MAAVSIGMPVYNGEKYLKQAIDSILSQSLLDIELIISDNASSDKTEYICRSYVEKDKRIKYFRQIENIGAESNFSFVLQKASSKYFMWAASDDIRCVNYIELNLDFLMRNNDFVCSTCPVKFENGAFDKLKMGDRELVSDSFEQRLKDFFGVWHANGAFYSLMRTSVIKQCPWVGSSFLGSDWAVVLYMVQKGKMKRLGEGWTELGVNGVSNSSEIFKRYRTSPLDYILPFWKLSVAVFRISLSASMHSKLILMLECLRMNLRAVRMLFLNRLYQLYCWLRKKK